MRCPGSYKPLYDVSSHLPLSCDCPSLREKELQFQQGGINVSYLSFPWKQNASAGTILQRCLSQVSKFRDRIGRSLCVYKVGLTSNPLIRFQFYRDANYTHMWLLHATGNLGVAQMLEAAVISSNLGEKGCRNQRYGGEGPPLKDDSAFHFVYVVGARADTMKPIG